MQNFRNKKGFEIGWALTWLLWLLQQVHIWMHWCARPRTFVEINLFPATIWCVHAVYQKGASDQDRQLVERLSPICCWLVSFSSGVCSFMGFSLSLHIFFSFFFFYSYFLFFNTLSRNVCLLDNGFSMQVLLSWIILECNLQMFGDILMGQGVFSTQKSPDWMTEYSNAF